MMAEDQETHIMRPGPIRGTQILCEPDTASGYVAELSERGMRTVTCEFCMYIMRELSPFGIFFKHGGG